MVKRLKESYRDGTFVAFYKGKKFYTGELDSGLTDSLTRLFEEDSLAYDDALNFLDEFDFSDPITDELDAASILVQGLNYDAMDGEDYWNFGRFEIFPESDLAESVRRRKNTKRFRDIT